MERRQDCCLRWKRGKRVVSIYVLWNVADGRFYIGSTKQRSTSRRRGHFRDLRSRKHCNRSLQTAFDGYGECAFRFEVIAECEDSLRNQIETAYIVLLDACNQTKGYNLEPFSRMSTKGIKRSQETIEKIRRANLGKKHPPFSKEWRHNLSKGGKGKPRPWQIGNTFGTGNNSNKGKTLAEEHKAKIAASHIGIRPNEKTRAKLRAAWERRRSLAA
jgi:group I intron endonuclease